MQLVTSERKAWMGQIARWSGLVGLWGFIGAAFARAPLQVAALAVGAGFLAWIIWQFELAVILLLVLRSSLDPFSSYGLTSALALLVDAVLIGYLAVSLVIRRPIQWDWFWLVLLGFVLLMGLWPVAMWVGWLGQPFDAGFLSMPTLGQGAVREWIRVLSYGMIYGLVMQLRGRIPPNRVLNLVMLSLVVPVTVAFLQMSVNGILPFELRTRQEDRVFGTVAHPDTFVVYLLLMMGLSWWKYQVTRHWFWLVLLAVLLVPYTATKTLAGLGMMVVFAGLLILPRLNWKTIVGGVLAVGLLFALFASTPLGAKRLESLRETPIFNGNFDVSSAVHLSSVDSNSFTWRLAQWTYLVHAWQQAPLLGHGLDTSSSITPFGNGAHNDYVRALAETGIVGLLLYLGLWAAMLGRLVSLIRSAPPGSAARQLRWILLAVALSVAFGNLTNHLWNTTTYYFYWWTVLAVAGWPWPREEAHDESHIRPLPRPQ